MPTLFEVGAYRIAVFTNDHGPAHVHAVGEGHAKISLGDSPGEVREIESDGISKKDMRRILGEVIDRHQECIEAWRLIHGN
jgi:hypothetical protein